MGEKGRGQKPRKGFLGHMRAARKEVVSGVKEVVTGGETEEIVCHGCEGKGWIETKDGQVKTCPVCGGSGTIIKE